ncbi:Phosphatidylinositol-3,5-trisphosphate 3-phosphatase anddual-specificity protein phosphatase PTEN [Striga asiatica]|uniref:Phosphatidylinositol-3,5-trisphosphate 3-phosphatase anddual-specificity protein phosphatase PTEN n=1 Tax=Striga asiatica TaxID=4170 RepID=A0A5A7PDZ4_STRAF|nr:Phosphatidylinositol-3,5-trisphosphate 3-phosphatase anddual-specificity protein phosphatase PTEN [Striga asiatica]
MDSGTAESIPPQPDERSDDKSPPSVVSDKKNSAQNSSSGLSTSAISSWAKSLNLLQKQQDSQTSNSTGSTFSRFTSGLGLQISSKASSSNESASNSSTSSQSGVIGSLTKGIVDSSLNAVKAVQVKARHIVSQNKRRYQEGGFDLDMTYITENIIAMGFPAGDLSSGLFGYFEGFYRNHMEEVIKFFETHHKGKYKVYNLCSERLYDASLFEGKVATFPFDDHNCPPIELIKLFCQSAYSWLKEDIVNVVVVHCKAGKARTGLMICSLLLFLKFFPSAEECINYYNQQRCIDGKGLILPSQIRYVKYFEQILTQFNGETPPGRRCMLRGFRLLNCPYWVRPSITISNHNGVLFTTKKHPRTKDLMPEDFWIRARKKGVVVFALPGEPGLTKLVGDFKIHFHDRQGDFYCWMNTTMMENRTTLDGSDLDGFDSRKLPSPGFQVEIVMTDYNETVSTETKTEHSSTTCDGKQASPVGPSSKKEQNDKDDVFTDSEGEEEESSSSRGGGVGPTQRAESSVSVVGDANAVSHDESKAGGPHNAGGSRIPNMDSTDIKAIAADASVFSFGDDEDYESD